MGVTSGGLQPDEYQIITITVPAVALDADATALAKDLQDVIDAFNAGHGSNPIEVLS